jgi:hypothetical protein
MGCCMDDLKAVITDWTTAPQRTDPQVVVIPIQYTPKTLLSHSATTVLQSVIATTTLQQRRDTSGSELGMSSAWTVCRQTVDIRVPDVAGSVNGRTRGVLQTENGLQIWVTLSIRPVQKVADKTFLLTWPSGGDSRRMGGQCQKH